MAADAPPCTAIASARPSDSTVHRGPRGDGTRVGRGTVVDDLSVLQRHRRKLDLSWHRELGLVGVILRGRVGGLPRAHGERHLEHGEIDRRVPHEVFAADDALVRRDRAQRPRGEVR